MNDDHNFYIDGRWVGSAAATVVPVINPATEQPIASVALGGPAEVERAVAAAKRAFPAFAAFSRQQRIALLESVIASYRRHADQLAEAISLEMGAPLSLTRQAHVPVGLSHLTHALKVLREYPFDERLGNTIVTREPIGVCALITPWNWPLNQIACKVGPALATGCTMVLKPSEMAPLSARLFTRILHEAGVPPGVFNLVNGDGARVGAALVSHPDVDMVSFTGSTRAGIAIAKAAADTVKRVQQELGGKSPNIVLDDADFAAAIKHAAEACFKNSGQSCNAPTRLLVPRQRQEETIAIAREVAERTVVGNPLAEGTVIGPVVGSAQFERIQTMIDIGVREGARLVAGGPGRPEGVERGYFVRPTVFAEVDNSMTIAREEIFGPVLCILPYDSEAEAIRIANDTEYGLSAYVSSGDPERARRVARQIRAGMVHLNGAPSDQAAPFGGYKRSGNGREWGRFGFEDFLEVKSMFGY